MFSPTCDSVCPLPLSFFSPAISLRPNLTLCHKPFSKLKFRVRCSSEPLPNSTIQRIADKLRSLGIIEQTNSETLESRNVEAGEVFIPLREQLPKYRVGHTLDSFLSTPGKSSQEVAKHDEDWRITKEKRTVPSLAELALGSDELKRLQRIGIREKRVLKVGKAGITEGIVNGIHERWKHTEVVKIACEDLSKINMKQTHDIIERKTGGMVVWRSGSRIVLYRGANYTYPYFISSNKETLASENNETPFPSSSEKVSVARLRDLVHGVASPNLVRVQLSGEAKLVEEIDRLLEDLGPRFTEWWGYLPLPVDADLLPAIIPGYRRPFRLLPYGLSPKLTNDEITFLKRKSSHLPFHFVLSRNTQLQGLAASIFKLWEKCEVVKIAIKPSCDANTKTMADELKSLTGGDLLARSDEFIVMYRGKDFLLGSVSSSLDERRKNMMRIKGSTGHFASNISSVNRKEMVEEGLNRNEVFKIRKKLMTDEEKRETEDVERELLSKGSTMQFFDGNRKENFEEMLKRNEEFKIGKDLITNEEQSGTYSNKELTALQLFNGSREETVEQGLKRKEVSKLRNELIKNEEKHGKEYVEKEISNTEPTTMKFFKEIGKEKGEEQVNRKEVRETKRQDITEEERYMLRKIGMKMDSFLLIGQRGVFSGTIENMHLHWKYRELVKLITKEKSIDRVHEAAMVLETQSGGILVCVEKIRKGYAIIIYRGKSYTRPSCLRPPTLPSKKEALRLSKEAQRRKSRNLDVFKFDEQKDESATASISIASTQNLVDDVKHPVAEASVADDCERPVVEAVEDIKKKEGNISQEQIMDLGFTKRGSKAMCLSNKERLLLRRQALSMKKRPMIAVGRTNVISGVTKTIKLHFERHPLAIVNIKGRAEGTNVRELISMLEEETGSVFVSQEPNKIILYRGWNEQKDENVTNEEELSVSDELIAAIKFECGRQN